MLLTREHIHSFWKGLGRPIGMGAKVVRSDAWRFPRTPRIVTLLLACIAAGILLRSEMRTAISMVARSVTGTPWDSTSWRSVKELRRKAAEAGDPKLLGLLSLLADSETERVRLANEAIAKDASLTWLAYEFRLRREEPDEAVIERAKRVEKWDPENVAPRLMAAEPIFDRIARDAKLPSLPGFSRTAELNPLEKASAANSEWMATMDWAFSAKSYDTYGTQRLELLREVARKYGVNDPDITARVVAGQMMPNFLNVRTYARVLLYRGAESRNDAATMADAWKVLHFTQQMQLHGQALLEDAVAAWIAIEACSRLQPLLKKAGHGEEAAMVAFERDRWKVEQERLKSRNLRYGDRVGTLVWAGVTIHAAVAAIAVFGGLSLAALVLLAWRRSGLGGWLGGLSSAAADWAPALLVAACLTLFVAYQPYAREYQTYFQDKTPVMNSETTESLIGAAAVTSYLPEGMEYGLNTPQVAYTGWMAITLMLVMTAGVVMMRGWRRSWLDSRSN